MRLFPSGSLVPIQPNSEAAESCDHVTCAWCPVCGSAMISVQATHVYFSGEYIGVSVSAFQPFLIVLQLL